MTMHFKYFVLFLTISLPSCMPQGYNWPYYWRNRPRSIPNTAYFSNHPANYQDPQDFKRYDTSLEYRPYRDPQDFKRYDTPSEYRPYPYYPSKPRGPTARTDDFKEGRIMNSPPGDPMGAMVLNDQPTDFVFPGYVNTPTRPTIAPSITVPTKSPANLKSRNPYIPDPDVISKYCGNDMTFCDTIDNYPGDYINNVLTEDDSFRDLFGKDELIPVNISTRIGVDDVDGTPMCAASERVIQPPVGKNMNNEWKFIVNDDKHIQGIRVELCKNTGSKCKMSENFPLTYDTECKQKYIFRKLLALGEDGKIQTDNFRIPSCCVCVYKSKRFARSLFGL